MSVESSFRTLNKRVAECQRHIEQLNVVDSFRVREEVAQLIRADIRALERELSNARQFAEIENKSVNKPQIASRITDYENQFRQLHKQSRIALLESKQRIENQERMMRQELFGDLAKDGKGFEQYELKQRNHNSRDSTLLRASSDVTEALRRTSTLMQQELEKSSYSASMLADSSKTLSSTHAEYQNLASLMVISKKVITQLEASDWLDRLSLLFGVLLFCMVALYIIKRRTWDVGVSWVSWILGKGKIATSVETPVAAPVATPVTTVLEKAFVTASSVAAGATETIATVFVKDEL